LGPRLANIPARGTPSLSLAVDDRPGMTKSSMATTPRTKSSTAAVKRNGVPPDVAVDASTANAIRVEGHLTDETELLRRYAQTHDPRLKEELVNRFLPLARSLALRYRGASEQLEDLIQVASLGLVKALDGFDLERGRSFIAYAAPTILGELRRHFRDRVWELRLPRGLQERTMAVAEAAQKLGEELGRTPTVAQIAERLELSEEEIAEALQAEEARRTLSLDVPRSREDAESAPMVETVGQTDSGYDRVEAQIAAEGAPLTDRERTVLRLRFEEDLNQYEIGRRLGVSQMQVSRIMRKALRKLLEAVQAEGEGAAP
jgi:RNA polymerase sigma-B factor